LPLTALSGFCRRDRQDGQNLIAGSMCKGRAESLDPKEDRRKLYPEIALRNAMQQDFDPEYGRVSSIRCQSGRR
jgi:hypothetical protein